MANTPPVYFFALVSDQGGSTDDVYPNVKEGGRRFLVAFPDLTTAQGYAAIIRTDRRSFTPLRYTWERMRGHALNGPFAGVHLGPPEYVDKSAFHRFPT